MSSDETPWLRALLGAKLSALDDLTRAECASVCFVRHERVDEGPAFLDALCERAERAGFVTARVPVFETRAFDALDGLVRAVGRALRAPGMGPHAHGVTALLDDFRARHGELSAERFEQASNREHFQGDLHSLCDAYLRGARRSKGEGARIDAWLSGTDVSRAGEAEAALQPVTPETARRSLGDLSVLSRVLGHRGTVLAFDGADVLAKLPASRRERAYVVLRELVDNTDGRRGLRSVAIFIAGRDALFDGAKSMRSLAPLYARVGVLDEDDCAVPPPHAPYVELQQPARWAPPALSVVREARKAQGSPEDLRSLVRGSSGIPPVDAVVALSVGHERVDEAIDRLFAYTAHDGSVFALLVGPYGSGKTHVLLHLAARALEARRPVLRLSVEQLSVDLGSPQKHMRRLLQDTDLPLKGAPSPLEWLTAATRTVKARTELLAELDAIASSGGDLAAAAKKVLRLCKRKGARVARVLESFFSVVDLADKPSNPSYRQDAYERLLLWMELWRRRETLAGPVVLIDEAENLFRPGSTRVDRRTALRSLSFYCGGTLPGACVIAAITPEALAQLLDEAPGLLSEVEAQAGTLAWEDASMFARRLPRTKPIEAPSLGPEHRRALVDRVRALHARVRGPVRDPEWAAFAARMAKSANPRSLVRAVFDRLERLANA